MDRVILNTIIRSVGVYILAILLTRLMGRKLIAQMTFFDFVIGVSMGSIIANSIVGQQFTSMSAITALILVSVLIIITGYVHIKSFKARKIIDSEPVTLVQNGTIVEENMKNVRLTINELMMKLREKNSFNLADVEFAIMENDGELSVLTKADKQPLTPGQMNIQATSTGLMRDIILDGNVMEENLSSAGLNKEWLQSQLNSQNIKDISEVFYAGLDDTKRLCISKKEMNDEESHGEYGIE
ncbi:DUF421 domain-containing protein [Clostridium sp. PL3]|uniref:DUF421 domain-containing protein n=1 Tax=Clostridium thailandense TaxID=2794346 RepID=A0A949WQB4_9CLOT|nr:DUF421 domain-containing protein [Clostridium thailandense]MBV7272541.1 DUF421 domain-containing protein [Clostridium thailandense]